MIKIISETTQTLGFNPNEKRKRLLIQMQYTNDDANNTGAIYVGLGFQPTGVVGNPNQGFRLTQGSFIDFNEVLGTLPPAAKLHIWLFSDTASQSYEISEIIEP